MKNLLNKSRKSLGSCLLAVMLTFGVVGTYQVISEPIEAKAHYAAPHSYPGYLIKYNPSYYDVHVVIIQNYLNWHEPDEHQYNVGASDGLFGSNTLNAVRQFQADHGLTVDGIVGSQTWNAIVYGTLCP